MEASAARPQLPALAFLDADKAKKEEEAYQSRHTGVISNAIKASQESSYSYPQGPPPPYSHPIAQPPTIQTASAGELYTPPGSRRPSGEKDVAAGQVAVKQSLPSISEALGVDNQPSYHQTPLSKQSAISAPPILPLSATLQKSLPSDSPIPAMRSYAAEAPRPQGEGYTQYAHPPASPKYPATEAPRPLFPDIRPALHVSTAQPSYPAAASNSYSHTVTSSSPVYERSQHHGRSSGSYTYGYAPYPPRYQSGSSNNGPIYAPSSSTSAPSWKMTRREGEESYGESVKRHLDLYDLEAALNDITASCNFLGDFAHRYGNLLHQAPRTGPHLSTLPGIIEIEDMIAKSRAQTESLIKIRENVLAQQAAHDQEAAEQRQLKGYADMAPPQSGDSDDGKSNFSGADTKKRRGRAAPPGRCHSCNRAETPEWRRGPDGARTLCNACGLHYAKLTRKQTHAGKMGGFNSSNLRPKEHMP